MGLPAQALGPLLGVALVREGELVAQVAEPGGDRRGREHEHLGGHAVFDHAVKQALVAVLARLLAVARRTRAVGAVSEFVVVVDDLQMV